MQVVLSLCFLLALCGCSTLDRSPSRRGNGPAALNGEFLRVHHPRFSKQDRALIADAVKGIRQTDKFPKNGSNDAYYRIRHVLEGHEVFVIYVTGYDGDQPILTPCVHNEVLLGRNGDVVKVLGGPECWP